LAVFRRRELPPSPVKHYSEYRSLVRDDFQECCAYCLLHEDWAAGQENFELDHFRPSFLFPSLEKDFYNLYYACHPCNRLKGRAWPEPSLEAEGYVFLNFCAEAFSSHFSEDADGSWKPLSRRAEYTLERLRLNRKHLVRIRLLFREVASERGSRLVDWDLPTRDQLRALLEGIVDS